jgi:hypothetical protein
MTVPATKYPSELGVSTFALTYCHVAFRPLRLERGWSHILRGLKDEGLWRGRTQANRAADIVRKWIRADPRPRGVLR